MNYKFFVNIILAISVLLPITLFSQTGESKLGGNWRLVQVEFKEYEFSTNALISQSTLKTEEILNKLPNNLQEFVIASMIVGSDSICINRLIGGVYKEFYLCDNFDLQIGSPERLDDGKEHYLGTFNLKFINNNSLQLENTWFYNNTDNNVPVKAIVTMQFIQSENLTISEH